MRRRKVLKTTGVLASIGIPGTAVAEKEDEKIPAAEVGLSNKVAELLRKNEIQKAQQLLEENDIRHEINHSKFSPSQKKGDISTQGWIAPKDDSEVYCSLVHSDGDRWLATGVAEISSGPLLDPNAREARYLDDAVGLSWDNSEWTSPDRSQDNLWFNVGSDVDGWDRRLSSDYNDYERYGVCGSVNYHGPSPADFWVNLQTHILRRNSHPDIGVKFEYEHTYALHSASNISPGIGVGGLSISLPAGAGSWTLEETADPDD